MCGKLPNLVSLGVLLIYERWNKNKNNNVIKYNLLILQSLIDDNCPQL